MYYIFPVFHQTSKHVLCGIVPYLSTNKQTFKCHVHLWCLLPAAWRIYNVQTWLKRSQYQLGSLDQVAFFLVYPVLFEVSFPFLQLLSDIQMLRWWEKEWNFIKCSFWWFYCLGLAGMSKRFSEEVYWSYLNPHIPSTSKVVQAFIHSVAGLFSNSVLTHAIS